MKIEGQFDDVTIEGIQGDVSVETVRGDIVIEEGGSGNRQHHRRRDPVEGGRGKLTLSSVNQGIKVTGASGEISAETTNGSITLDADGIEHCRGRDRQRRRHVSTARSRTTAATLHHPQRRHRADGPGDGQRDVQRAHLQR